MGQDEDEIVREEKVWVDQVVNQVLWENRMGCVVFREWSCSDNVVVEFGLLFLLDGQMGMVFFEYVYYYYIEIICLCFFCSWLKDLFLFVVIEVSELFLFLDYMFMYGLLVCYQGIF